MIRVIVHQARRGLSRDRFHFLHERRRNKGACRVRGPVAAVSARGQKEDVSENQGISGAVQWRKPGPFPDSFRPSLCPLIVTVRLSPGDNRGRFCNSDLPESMTLASCAKYDPASDASPASVVLRMRASYPSLFCGFPRRVYGQRVVPQDDIDSIAEYGVASFRRLKNLPLSPLNKMFSHGWRQLVFKSVFPNDRRGHPETLCDRGR